MLPWEELSADLIEAYRGKGILGRRPYGPVRIINMQVVSYLDGISERQVQEMVSSHLVVKWFVGLAVDESAADHSTLTQFKNRYL